MSSPNLNNIIILGCILCYISVILLGLDARILSTEEYTSICNVRYNLLMFVFRKIPNDYRPTKGKQHQANLEIATIADLTLRFEVTSSSH